MGEQRSDRIQDQLALVRAELMHAALECDKLADAAMYQPVTSNLHKAHARKLREIMEKCSPT
jgi:hypothetical protein